MILFGLRSLSRCTLFLKRFSLCFFSCCFFLAFLSSCQKTDREKSSLPPLISVSISPYSYFVERIAKETVRVHTLVPPGANPHLFEPTPKQAEFAGKSVLWLRVGEPFEKKILKVLQEKHPQLVTIDLAEGFSLLPLQEDLCSSKGHVHDIDEGKDRHLWLSPQLAMIQASKIASLLIQLFPENRSLYEKELSQLLIDLKTLDLEIAALLKPFQGQAILVSHPAFGYFCKEFGLIQLSIECEGKDPLPQSITQIIHLAEKYRIRSVLTQAQYSNKGAQLIAEKLHLPIHSFDPYSNDYCTNLHHLAELIAGSSSS
ncbi:MAG: metal ABC transporter solute-binding protein, Zn/Mn family [Anaerolineae bacterium]